MVYVRDFFNERFSDKRFTHFLFYEGFNPIKILIVISFNSFSLPSSFPIIKFTSKTISIKDISLLSLELLKEKSHYLRLLISFDIVKNDILNDINTYLKTSLVPFSCTYESFMHDLKTIGIQKLIDKHQPYFPRKLISPKITTFAILKNRYEESYEDFDINPIYELAKTNSIATMKRLLI